MEEKEGDVNPREEQNDEMAGQEPQDAVADGAIDQTEEKNGQEAGTEGETQEGGEEMTKESLVKQVEFYFAPDHLAFDPYLRSMLDADLYVPIESVAQLPMVSQITRDVALISECLKDSKLLEVDESGTLVRPAISVQRKTLILRDVAPEAVEEDIRNLFKKDGQESAFGKIESIKQEIENMWFVAFEDDSEILDALDHVHGKELYGKKIMPRIKSESLLQTAYSQFLHTPPQNQIYDYSGGQSRAGGNAQYGYQQQRQMEQGYYYPDGNYYAQTPYQQYGYDYSRGNQQYPKYHKRNKMRMRRDAYQRGVNYEGNQFQGNKAKKGKKARKDQHKQAQVQLGAQHFPPLPSAQRSKENVKTGYKSSYIKYTQDDIRDIVRSLPKADDDTHNLPFSGFPLVEETMDFVRKPKNNHVAQVAAMETAEADSGDAQKKIKPSFADILQK